jgi:hypothetical protein
VHCSAISILLDIRDSCQGTVHPPPVFRLGSGIDGRTDQWVSEFDPGFDQEKTAVHRTLHGDGGETEYFGSPSQRFGIAGGFRGRNQKEELCVVWQLTDLAEESGLDQIADWQGVGQGSLICEMLRGQLAAEFHQGQRIAPRGSGDSFRHPVTHWHRNGRFQQVDGEGFVKAVHVKRWNALKRSNEVEGVPDRKYEGDPIGVQSASHEDEGGYRLVVEPLSVVHDDQERCVAGNITQNGEGGKAYQEPVGRRPRGKTEGGV